MTPTDIATLVREVLGTDQIGVDDNFFAVGGNSLLALTLMSKIKERYGATVSLIDVIRNPTPEGLARLVAHAEPDHAATGPAGVGGGT